MRPEAPALLWDARRAAGLILDFVQGRTWDEYCLDTLLRSAVERQFQIVGDALNRLRKADPETAGKVPDLIRIIGFRNVLVHGYAQVDDALVWETATTRAVRLSATLDALLEPPATG